MARAAVKAKAKAKQGAQPAKPAGRRQGGRRRHAAGGNPNQDLFFTKLRKRAKFVYVLLAVLFGITFAFLGVGSGQGGGLDQLFQGLNIFHHSSDSVSKAESYIKAHPAAAKGYRELATAYEAKGDSVNAISALQQYTGLKPKDAKTWAELGGLQLSQAQLFLQQYQQAYTNRQLLTPSQSFLPTGKLGQALGTNRVEQVAGQNADAIVQNLQQQTQRGYTDALASYGKVTRLTPRDSNAWFQYAQTAQQTGNYAAAVTGYKRYLKLNPASTSKAQIEQLIKQLSPAPAAPPKKTK
jgi:tetratricopeptide (TPR) repeat protein